ncbi:hypothetical protein [Burkholderia cepacia]|uniref:hypothetical protein n=1 Tax=Burkholderia cepacia TaxID=292 RepID=UPI0012DB6115|nr:hypothetical protein [Burkholderia cepacia]
MRAHIAVPRAMRGAGAIDIESRMRKRGLPAAMQSGRAGTEKQGSGARRRRRARHPEHGGHGRDQRIKGDHAHGSRRGRSNANGAGAPPQADESLSNAARMARGLARSGCAARRSSGGPTAGRTCRIDRV